MCWEIRIYHLIIPTIADLMAKVFSDNNHFQIIRQHFFSLLFFFFSLVVWKFRDLDGNTSIRFNIFSNTRFSKFFSRIIKVSPLPLHLCLCLEVSEHSFNLCLWKKNPRESKLLFYQYMHSLRVSICTPDASRIRAKGKKSHLGWQKDKRSRLLSDDSSYEAALKYH